MARGLSRRLDAVERKLGARKCGRILWITDTSRYSVKEMVSRWRSGEDVEGLSMKMPDHGDVEALVLVPPEDVPLGR